MRVAIAEDAVLFREGLARLLIEANFDVVAQVGTAAALLQHVATDPPDVVILDIRMPPTHTIEGLEAARALRITHPDLGVLVLSHHVEAHYALQLLDQGAKASGYLLKERVTDLTELVDALHRIAAGGLVIDPAVVAQLVGRPQRRRTLELLSERERDVLALMAEGRSNAAISERLFLSPKTVEAYVGGVFAKLDLRQAPDDNRRVLAVLAYLRG